MNKVSYRVALGGVISSLCIFSMILAGVIPVLYLTMPMIAGALMTIIVNEVNKSWAFLTYAEVSILSLFVAPDKEAALIFILLFGYYPIIKDSIEKMKSSIIKFIMKLVIFNISAVVDYQITIHILGISDMADSFPIFGKFGIYVFLGLCNIFFFVYDYALTGCIELYARYLKPKIYGTKSKSS